MTEQEFLEEMEALIVFAKELEIEGIKLCTGIGKELKVNIDVIKLFIKKRKQEKAKISSSKKLMQFFYLYLNKLQERKHLKKQKGKLNKDQGKGIDSTKFLENELERAVYRLKSDSTIDSDANDLKILEDMAKVNELSSTLSLRGKNNIHANLAINRFTVTNGGANLTGAVNRQALKNNSESMSKSLRLHLENESGKVINVDISSLPITEAAVDEKERRNEKYYQSLQSVRQNERKREERN